MDTERTECIRCGDCCRAGSPTLHISDVGLVKTDRIPLRDLYTIRIGEPVYDNLNGRIVPVSVEMIKIKERRHGGGCVFLDETDQRCLIYEYRPCQCSAMKCWDDNEFKLRYGEPRGSRWDLVEDERMLALMEEHERRTGYGHLKESVKAIQSLGETAVEEVLNEIRFDHHIRLFAGQKLGTSALEMDFYFGRPLSETIEVFGLQVRRQMDGTFLLTTADRS